MLVAAGPVDGGRTVDGGHRVARTVKSQITTRAADRRADDSAGPVRPLYDSPGRRHRAGPLARDSQVAAPLTSTIGNLLREVAHGEKSDHDTGGRSSS